MKLHLASILQPQNFGPGRVIGIVDGTKPRYIKADLQFKPLVPSSELLQAYIKNKNDNLESSGKIFINGYQVQLDGFINKVQEASKNNNTDPKNVLPFQDGDTLI